MYFPDENEAYSAKFSRSSRLELKISDIFEQYFKPELLRVSKKHLKYYDFRCDKLEIGDYYRTHIDDYAGAIGSIYYFNKRWCWDWGGILHIGDSDDSLISIFPYSSWFFWIVCLKSKDKLLVLIKLLIIFSLGEA